MRIVVGIAVALSVTWLVMVAALLVVRPRAVSWREAVRLLPDTLRLLGKLAMDRGATRGVRIRLWLLFAYLAMPFDHVDVRSGDRLDMQPTGCIIRGVGR